MPGNQTVKNYLQKAFRTIAEASTRFSHGELDEQAIPAYLHGNPLSRWLFRRRLNHTLSLLPPAQKGECMDFGCGSGLLLPFLAQRYTRVFGVDTELDLCRAVLEAWPERKAGNDWEKRITLCDSIDALADNAKRFECILALDVLEHVDDLEHTLLRLAELLRPGGILIVSGPTENLLYRIGRRIVGFSGHYHHRNIHDILQAMRVHFTVDTRITLLPMLPLFLIATAHPKGSA